MDNMHASQSFDASKTMSFDWIPHSPKETVLGHDIDLLGLFTLIKREHDNCYMLESISHPRHQDRFHVIGFDPVAQFTARGDTLTVTGRSDVLEKCLGEPSNGFTITGANPYDYLANNAVLDKMGATHQGGLIGFFCHEAMNYFEETPTGHYLARSRPNTLATLRRPRTLPPKSPRPSRRSSKATAFRPKSG